MAQDQPAVDFLHALTAAILQEGDPGEAAARAHAALRTALAERKSLVLDVQFTGFTAKGQLVGGVDPRLLRAAGQLIMNRVSRVGFTAEAGVEDLATLAALAAKSPGALGGKGIVDALQAAPIHGVYVSTAGGETYRPPSRAPSPAPSPAHSPEAEATPSVESPSEAPPSDQAIPSDQSTRQPRAEAEPGASTPPADAATEEAASATTASPREAEPTGQTGRDVLGFDVQEFSFSDFEILEAFPELPDDEPEPASGGGGEASAPARPPEPAVPTAGTGDMFQFFRASGPSSDPPPAEIKRMLHGASSVNVFDEVAQSCARVAQRLVEDGAHGAAVDLLDTLVREAQRPDRTRLFRENAVGALRRVGSDGTLHYLLELLQHGSAERERILRIFTFVGGDALVLLEGMLFRTADTEMRREMLRCLLPLEGMGPRLMARTMSDASPPRTRALLELAVEVSAPDAAAKWVAEAALHPDAAVRAEAARHAAAAGGRTSLRVLVELLGDADRDVLRAAIQGLGAMGDPAAVTFLARKLAESDEEDVQLAVIHALGRIGSAEAVPTLIGVVNKRQLFSGKKLVRAKTAALAALGKIPTPAARELLASVAAGRDADLAPEARRILSLTDAP